MILMTSQLCLFLVSIFVFPIFHNVAFGQSDTTPLIKEFPVPPGSHPHDVAPAKNGSVWYTAQRLGELGILDPISGRTHHIELGQGSAPHGVIVGPDEAPWITDGGLNAIVRVDPTTKNVTVFRLPENTGNANLNTATFDHKGILWFTGQGGHLWKIGSKYWKNGSFRSSQRAGTIWYLHYTRRASLFCIVSR